MEKKRSSETNKLDSVLGKMIDEYNLGAKFARAQVISEWEEIVGKTIAGKTEKIYFIKGKLFVEVSSAPLRHQLSLSKSKIMEIIENKYGKGTVADIVFR